MKKRKIPFVFLLSICLILAGVIFALVFRNRMQEGIRKSQSAAEELENLLPKRTPGTAELYPGSEMPVLEVNGTDYVALLEVPSFGLSLPVAAKWTDNKTAYFPERFWGSVYDGTLIVGGYDHPQQFGFCDEIEHGTLVTVTDMTGSEFTYTVSGVDRSRFAESQWLLEEEYDLTLFCLDIYSMEYVAVRCNGYKV